MCSDSTTRSHGAFVFTCLYVSFLPWLSCDILHGSLQREFSTYGVTLSPVKWLKNKACYLRSESISVLKGCTENNPENPVAPNYMKDYIERIHCARRERVKIYLPKISVFIYNVCVSE